MLNLVRFRLLLRLALNDKFLQKKSLDLLRLWKGVRHAAWAKHLKGKNQNGAATKAFQCEIGRCVKPLRDV